MMRHAKEGRAEALERLGTQPVLQRLVQVRQRVPAATLAACCAACYAAATLPCTAADAAGWLAASCLRKTHQAGSRAPPAAPHHPPSQEHGAALCVHFIGAHPARQGQGLGGAMLRHICSLADERRLHAYLEASTHRSKVGWSAVA